MVAVELCRSNSVGSRYSDPSVIHALEVTPKEARRLLKQRLPNGYFYRLQSREWDDEVAYWQKKMGGKS